jgi:hypothetical protein
MFWDAKERARQQPKTAELIIYSRREALFFFKGERPWLLMSVKFRVQKFGACRELRLLVFRREKLLPARRLARLLNGLFVVHPFLRGVYV